MSKLAAYSATRPRLLTQVLKAEINPSWTREDATLLAGSGADRAVVIGEVAGRRLFGAPVGVVIAGGTGDGGIGSIALGASAKQGDYLFTCIAAAANAGTFEVIDPDGYRLADLEVGVAYVSPQIECTISDGAADFVVGDQRKLTVPKGDLKVTAIDFAAVDGSQRFAGSFARNTTAPDGVDAPTQLIKQMALLAADELVWPAGATDAQKAAALAEAEAKFITTLPLA